MIKQRYDILIFSLKFMVFKVTFQLQIICGLTKGNKADVDIYMYNSCLMTKPFTF